MTTDPARPGRDEALAGRLLGAGVWTSAACLGAGLLAQVAGGPPGADGALLTSGLLLLMATPALRVGVAIVEALRARDWTFAASSVAVALVLVATVVSALAIR